MLIVDEIEAHLHAKWQRTILPPILKIADLLKKGVSTQIFATTHSPLVLASLDCREKQVQHVEPVKEPKEFNDRCRKRGLKWLSENPIIPISRLRNTEDAPLIYDWTNFRYAEGIINQSKWAHTVLDPFEVQDDWFELLLPSMQLVLTDKIPKNKRKIAGFTLEKLKIGNGEVVIRCRAEWFEQYKKGDLTLDGLRNFAPQVAQAVERDLKEGIDWRVV